MIQSIDTYLYREVNDKLKIILQNRYIIEEILKDIQPEIANSFMKKYVDKEHEIPVIYTMPQTKELQRASIYIGLREGEESTKSVGNIEDVYGHKGEDVTEEVITMHSTEDKKRIYFETQQDIAELLVVEGVSFSDNDDLKVEGNKVSFVYDPYFEELKFLVKYEISRGDEQGVRTGFTSTESYSILAVSTNMDTVRCLDLIIKAILILMRENKEEKNSVLLQTLHFGQIEEIQVGNNVENNPEMLYGRENLVTYTTTYSLDVPFVTKLKEIIFTSRQGRGE